VARGNPPPSDEAAFLRMSRQAQKDTRAELVVRSLLHRLGHRFRVRNRDLPGSPDAANRSKRWAVFVHGCYWHAHEGCARHTVPRRNREFWEEKFAANKARDARVVAELEEGGYTVVTVWECEVEDRVGLVRRVMREFKAHSSAQRKGGLRRS
jgi:DNA mismatch endonuclease (patch repair protein)